MGQKILGLDIGTNSLGWALIEHTPRSESEVEGEGKLMDAGARVFTAPVEEKDETPKNKKRREKRSARKIISRRKMRRDYLVKILATNGMFPAKEDREKFFADNDPYELRAKGLDEKLTLQQFGRALFHMNERRGFKSNRKTPIKESEKKRKVSTVTAELSKKINDSGARTLGEYLCMEKNDNGNRVALRGKPDAERYTLRDMYTAEFEKLWEAQSGHHAVLTKELKKGIFDAIFYQRPLKSQKGLVGFCDLERIQRLMRQTGEKDKRGRDIWKDLGKYTFGETVPPDCRVFEKGPRRADSGHPLAQRFRVMQDITNIKVNDKPLDAAQRRAIIDVLEGKEVIIRKSKKVAESSGMPKDFITWAKIKAAANLSGAKLNMEDSKDKGIEGFKTWSDMAEAMGKKKWDELSLEKRESLYTDLSTIEAEEAEESSGVDAAKPKNNALLKRLINALCFTQEEAERLAKIKLEKGYAAHSLKAIKNLLPLMEIDGLPYATAKKCFYEKASEAVAGLAKLPQPPFVRNPVVQKALYETRKVVNAIIDAHGIPGIIRVELARDAKKPQKVRETIHAEQKSRRDEKERIKEEIRGYIGVPLITRDGKEEVMEWAIEKYRLWKESGGQCPYTGQTISASMLFSSDVEVDHIIPWSRSGDDSFANKVLCRTSANREKGNKTPFEAWRGTEQWEQIKTRLGNMPKITRYVVKRNRDAKKPWDTKEVYNPKWDRVLWEEIPEEYRASRSLNDTRYITTEVCRYLESLGVKVQTNKGLFTAILRRHWGLMGNREKGIPAILQPRNYDVEKGKDRSDHRHHSVDAVVIALTDAKLVKRMSDSNTRTGRAAISIENLPKPWPTFYEDVKDAIDRIIVSHRATRKIRGALHDELPYGLTNEAPKTNGNKVYVRRVAIKAITRNMADNIRDEIIRAMVVGRIKELDVKAAQKSEFFLESKKGKIPIKKVRVTFEKNPDTGTELIDKDDNRRYVTYGKNHHIEIIRNLKTGKYTDRVVPMMEAARRARRSNPKEPIIKKDHGPDYHLEMSLSKNEMVRFPWNGGYRYYRVRKFTKGKITLAPHNVAGDEYMDEWVSGNRSANELMKLQMEKITISPIGEVYPAND